jgi:hypothetical protein
MLSRRGFIRSVVFASAGSACAMSTASALTLDAEPSTSVTRLYHEAKAACGRNPDAYHQELLAEAQAMLEKREVPAEQRLALLASVSCPICGCLVAER